MVKFSSKFLYNIFRHLIFLGKQNYDINSRTVASTIKKSTTTYIISWNTHHWNIIIFTKTYVLADWQSSNDEYSSDSWFWWNQTFSFPQVSYKLPSLLSFLWCLFPPFLEWNLENQIPPIHRFFSSFIDFHHKVDTGSDLI